MTTKNAARVNYVSKLKLVFAGIGVFFCIVFVVWVVNAVSRASEHHGPSELSLHPDKQNEIIAQHRVKQFQQQLALTDEQAAKAAAIIAEARREGDAILMDTSKDLAERVVLGKARIEERLGKVKDLLTDEQKTKFDEVMHERRERSGAMREMLGNLMQQGSESRRSSNE